MYLVCPQCNQPIDENDYNVSTDIAYCRLCDVKYSLATLSSMEMVDESTLENFERSYCEELGRGATAAVPFHKLFRIMALCFVAGVLLFGVVIGVVVKTLPGDDFAMMGWGVGAVFLMMLLTELPFAYLFGVGKYVVSLESGLLKVRAGASPFCRRKQIEITRESVVRIEKNSSCQVNNQPVDQITVETNGQKINFGVMMNRENKVCLVRWLAKHIK